MNRWQRGFVRLVDGIAAARDALIKRVRPKPEPFNKGFVCKQIFIAIFGATLIELFTNVSMQFFDPYSMRWQVFDPVTWPVEYSQIIYAFATVGALVGVVTSVRALIHLVGAANAYVANLKELEEQAAFEEYSKGVN